MERGARPFTPREEAHRARAAANGLTVPLGEDQQGELEGFGQARPTLALLGGLLGPHEQEVALDHGLGHVVELAAAAL